jgi:hypothetical protein
VSAPEALPAGDDQRRAHQGEDRRDG